MQQQMPKNGKLPYAPTTLRIVEQAPCLTPLRNNRCHAGCSSTGRAQPRAFLLSPPTDIGSSRPCPPTSCLLSACLPAPERTAEQACWEVGPRMLMTASSR